jgi:methyl-accepting chemotaxis protein
VANQAVLAGHLAGNASTITSDVDTALANTSWSELNGQLAGLGEIATEADTLQSELLAHLNHPAAVDVGSLAAAVSQGGPAGADALETLLQNRITGQRHSQVLIVSITVIALVLAAWFSIGVIVLTRDDAALTVEAVRSLAEGDLREQDLPDAQDEFGIIGRALADSTGALRAAMTAISDHAVTLASASEELAATNDSIATSAEQTTGKAGEVNDASQSVNTHTNGLSAAATEFSASIGEIAQNATEAAHIAASATGLAEQTTQTVDRLGTSSAEITDVIQLIRAVAEQTNLLALNATIEAARAGEAGRGFAVVATEVKDLAQQTETATSDITSRITQIQTESQAAMAAISQIGSVISQISEFQTSIAGAVEEQNATANEMSQQIIVVADSSAQIAENISTVTEAAKVTGLHVTESRSATAELARMSAELRKQVSQFQI